MTGKNLKYLYKQKKTKNGLTYLLHLITTGISIPICALQNMPLQLNISFKINIDKKYALIMKYVYLEVDEFRRFSQVSHEYLHSVIKSQTLKLKKGKNIFEVISQINTLTKMFLSNTKSITNGRLTTSQTQYQINKIVCCDLYNMNNPENQIEDNELCLQFSLKQEHQPSGICRLFKNNKLELHSDEDTEIDITFEFYNVLKFTGGLCKWGCSYPDDILIPVSPE